MEKEAIELKYYDIKPILSKGCQYNIIIGERSNGKTFAALQHGLEEYFQDGSELGIIRRYVDDFRGKRGASLFAPLIEAGIITKLSGGRWTGVQYLGQKWYFTCKKEGKTILSESPFAYAFALTAMEHDKSSSYPKIRNVVFDEFLTRSAYLPNEFVLFMNTLSTIIRQRNDVTIFMLGNTVNQYSPYFSEMGLVNVKKMKQGTIDIYRYADTGLQVAVEMCGTALKFGRKSSDVYFAFNNKRLDMITTGSWEMDIYPHLPTKYAPKDVVFTYYIEFEGETLQCDVVIAEDAPFTYIFRVDEVPEGALLYRQKPSHLAHIRNNFTKPTTTTDRKVWSFFPSKKVFYEDNEVGEIVNNYIQWCTNT